MSKGEKIGRIYFDASEPNLTQQSAKDECDINLIVERAKRGADISHLSKATPMYGDFTSLPDYRTALNMIRQAEAAFMSLDAFVRERFGNDPARMIDFLQDPKNRDEAVKLGLVTPKEAPVKPKESDGVSGDERMEDADYRAWVAARNKKSVDVDDERPKAKKSER